MAQCCNNSATKPDERSGESGYILEKLLLFHSCILTSEVVFQISLQVRRGKDILLAGIGEFELHQQ